MLYFSYGSFLDFETLKKHCPSAKIVARAVIPNWEVQFNFMSKTYNGGVTGIEPALNQVVYGVVYDVSEEEMIYLDTIEGVPSGIYYRHTITVVKDNGEILKAYTYRTTNPRGPFKPTKRYVGLMVKGAKEHGIEPDYVRKLESIETVD
jgi:gamma-glutamylcyclotransferase